MENQTMPVGKLLLLVLSRFIPIMGVIFALLFLGAGTLDYWQAWVYLGMLVTVMIVFLVYLLIKDRALLERRMRMREKEGAQKKFLSISLLYFILLFFLPPLGYRFGWPQAPVWAVILADVIVLIGYGIVIWTMVTNSYASRVVEVEKGQKVISTGPYAIARHPMYLGNCLMYLMTPLALGSFWIMLLGLLFPLVLSMRIRNEEEVLTRDLEGYAAYKEKVKYRIIPGIW